MTAWGAWDLGGKSRPQIRRRPSTFSFPRWSVGTRKSEGIPATIADYKDSPFLRKPESSNSGDFSNVKDTLILLSQDWKIFIMEKFYNWQWRE
ncbi:MAG: hypothetical protein HAW59_01445 [Betaproteobacteria bacterium]|nr:hypothetical protein [Betaproteobacteria bacterium]